MKKIFFIIACFLLIFAFYNCSDSDVLTATTPVNSPPPIVDGNLPRQYNYLALGDSYTIGQSVCETCRFPEQLRKKLGDLNPNDTYTSKIIATTGWTTTNLIAAINTENPASNYDLVSLLIGVNNQYQNKPFSLYETEFPELVNKAIALARGDKSNVIVVSIPDYAFTPFGKQSSNSSIISAEIDNYNAFAQKYCTERNIEFVSITDITRQGLTNPLLVATDGLHPSELAYSYFVERIFPKASWAINN
ncbi:SGNH/GDSL hydrolase family protein [Flavobacterium franklandianum]|uniref:SGNH/GDSL hydrolase family protein n=1 Tax=Flavobacterium franklandianum TaxID=2594430 RepID=A0A553CLA6_9FLAO|nr:SGNH/GDSL hydrolase family protein [Flavobacterium franklandianum]TRX21340.1 SGNH/GDSL hydrolase family protein [Flavobacterium franklandianum]TRX30018.1 SGNH/GDSL hydrolase family protein [Flavobacterium franklandianum]